MRHSVAMFPKHKVFLSGAAGLLLSLTIWHFWPHQYLSTALVRFSFFSAKPSERSEAARRKVAEYMAPLNPTLLGKEASADLARRYPRHFSDRKAAQRNLEHQLERSRLYGRVHVLLGVVVPGRESDYVPEDYSRIGYGTASRLHGWQAPSVRARDLPGVARGLCHMYGEDF